ncbi:hypothetical protein F5Y18DRAFT_430702 [Xylariaceae sp. FL1019]|nr:hypothetical protein F5Y18DRAFT_430702 [Xylariaceae sp. FL1019]
MRLISVYLALWPSLSQAANGNHFVSPKYQLSSKGGQYGGDDTWPLGSSQLIGFVTTFDAYKIGLWQQDVKGGAALSETLVYTQESGENKPQSVYWIVQTYELRLSDSPVFFFWLMDLNSTEQQASAYFNITLDNSSDPSTTSASNSANTTKSSKALSPSAAAGIGVGVSLGVVSLLGLAVFAIWRRRRQRKQQTQQQGKLQGSSAYMSHSDLTSKPTHTTEYADYKPRPTESRPQPTELAARTPRTPEME